MKPVPAVIRTTATTPAGLFRKPLPSFLGALGGAPTWASARGGTFIAATFARALAAKVGFAGAACFSAPATAGAATTVSPSKRTRAPAKGLAHEVRLMPSSCPVRARGLAERCFAESATSGRPVQRNEFPHHDADLVPAINGT